MPRRYADLVLAGTEGEQQQQTHYRVAGQGKPLILLHPSPLSSAFMEPVIDAVKNSVTAIAPDTPGYGQSDPLPGAATDLSPYVDWLATFIRSLGYASAGIYGSATGAQIAVQFARSYPEMADYLILDNAVHFTEEERQEILANYFPDMAPQADGSHLQTAWRMASGLFTHFPWYAQEESNRVADSTPPVAVVHSTALAYLNAGVEYDQAYRAAFLNEDAHNMQQIMVPTRVIRWNGSILKRYADRLDDFDWPDHIRMVPCEATPAARYAVIRQVVKEFN